MTSETQATSSGPAVSEAKGFHADISDVTGMMEEIKDRCRSIARKIQLSIAQNTYVDESASVTKEIHDLANKVFERKYKLYGYDIVPGGAAHVRGNRVECDGQTMDWHAFCAVRHTDGTIASVENNVKVGEHVLTVRQYLAAREVHHRNTEEDEDEDEDED